MSGNDAVDRAVRVDGSSLFLDGNYVGELVLGEQQLKREIRRIAARYQLDEATARAEDGKPGSAEPTLSVAMERKLDWLDSVYPSRNDPFREIYLAEIAAAARLERRVEDMGRRLECLESAQRAGTPSTTTTPTGQAPSGESQKSDATPAGQDSPQNTPSAPPVTAELEALIEAFDEERDDRTIQYNEAIALRGLPSGFDGGYRIVFDESFNALIRRVYHLRDAEVDALRAEAEKTRAELATAREEIARLDSGWGETRTLRKALELELTKARETIRSLTSVDWHGIADQRSAEIVRMAEELTNARDNAIEDCARVADPGNYLSDSSPEAHFGRSMAAAIRRMKQPRVADMPAQAGEHPGPEGHDVGLPSGGIHKETPCVESSASSSGTSKAASDATVVDSGNSSSQTSPPTIATNTDGHGPTLHAPSAASAVPGGFECEAWAWLGEHDNLPKLYPASWNACEVWNVGGRAFHVRIVEIPHA